MIMIQPLLCFTVVYFRVTSDQKYEKQAAMRISFWLTCICENGRTETAKESYSLCTFCPFDHWTYFASLTFCTAAVSSLWRHPKPNRTKIIREGSGCSHTESSTDRLPVFISCFPRRIVVRFVWKERERSEFGGCARSEPTESMQPGENLQTFCQGFLITLNYEAYKVVSAGRAAEIFGKQIKERGYHCSQLGAKVKQAESWDVAAVDHGWSGQDRRWVGSGGSHVRHHSSLRQTDKWCTERTLADLRIF